jgi:16S rRNA (uracil1498-N3)-methyltransferase
MVEPMFSKIMSGEIQIGSLIQLDGPEAKHAISVRRMRVGEDIQLSNGTGLRVRGEIKHIRPNLVEIQVTESLQETNPEVMVTLVQALAKGDRDELAIQAATELGVYSVIPWEADRSISKWIGLKEEKAVARWQTIVTEAAKQSLRSFTPIVKPAVATLGLSQLVSEFDSVLILDPTAEQGLGSLEFSQPQSLAIVVGPEGGITPQELEQLESAGAKRVRLGQSILRTSTAGVAAIAAIMAKTNPWR